MKFWRWGLRIGKLILRLKFRWYDFWVGVYYDRIHGSFYIILIPTLVLVIQFIPRFIEMDYQQAEFRMVGRISEPLTVTDATRPES
jgi:hypothetical protein